MICRTNTTATTRMNIANPLKTNSGNHLVSFQFKAVYCSAFDTDTCLCSDLNVAQYDPLARKTRKQNPPWTEGLSAPAMNNDAKQKRGAGKGKEKWLMDFFLS